MNSSTIDLKLNGIDGADVLLVRRWVGAGDPVLYIHGATFPSALSIGYRFEGRSWADHLHAQGFDVWGFDFVGFGGSPPYRQMSEPAAGNKPLGRTPDAVPQIAAVVEHIRRETGGERVHLVAHSWGTMAAGAYAAAFPESVARLVMFGPIVQRSMVGLPKPDAIGAWRHLSVAEQLARFVEDVPPDHPPVLIEPDLALWGPAWLATDAEASTRSPHAVKVPNGPLADNIAALSGQLAYDPNRVSAPTLVVRGAWDNLCQNPDAAWLMSRLGAQEKANVVIPAATHLMHLERGRDGLFAATADWLAA
ncbi:MAG: alpha/beta hydrolase [Rhizobiales bacterium]|nr:alpha/beta hydrolase [Hyphomicrobiales bacterium]